MHVCYCTGQKINGNPEDLLIGHECKMSVYIQYMCVNNAEKWVQKSLKIHICGWL